MGAKLFDQLSPDSTGTLLTVVVESRYVCSGEGDTPPHQP